MPKHAKPTCVWTNRWLPPASFPAAQRAIAPGDLSASALLDRVTTADPDQAMPPAGVGKRLTDVEVSILKQWIAEGADYTRHWAYVAPVRQPLPAVSQPAWPKNPIDYFLLARLDREGLKAAAEADRPTLLRRVALDLTGLPPTVEEVERFVADLRPDAYERAVDDLLAQQSYGERFAAMWLDLGRYGDSQGYIHDPPRTIWRWRDAGDRCSQRQSAPTTGSPSNCWPEICCRSPPPSRSLPPAFIATRPTTPKGAPIPKNIDTLRSSIA